MSCKPTVPNHVLSTDRIELLNTSSGSLLLPEETMTTDSVSINDITTTGDQTIAALGEGEAPPTTSPPGIHYTTTVDAKAFVDLDTCIFIAFDHTFKKRVLHTLKLNDNLSFFEERDLYLEESLLPHGKTNIFRLLSERFTSDDFPRMYLLWPLSGYRWSWTGPTKIREFEQQLRTISSQLPFVPSKLEFYSPPSYVGATTGGRTNTILVTAFPRDRLKRWPVIFDKDYYVDIS